MYASMLLVIMDMQEKQFGHSAVTSAGTPPFICWEVRAGSLTDLTLLSSHLLHPCKHDCPLWNISSKQCGLQWCREHLGLHPCDRRSSLTYLKQQYPAVDFSLVSFCMPASSLRPTLHLNVDAGWAGTARHCLFHHFMLLRAGVRATVCSPCSIANGSSSPANMIVTDRPM